MPQVVFIIYKVHRHKYFYLKHNETVRILYGLYTKKKKSVGMFPPGISENRCVFFGILTLREQFQFNDSTKG